MEKPTTIQEPSQFNQSACIRQFRGNGGAVRLVTLPLEAHGYAGRETIEHVLYEMINWFDKYVKNAPARTPKPQTAAN